jgi:adenylate cyclase, class 2
LSTRPEPDEPPPAPKETEVKVRLSSIEAGRAAVEAIGALLRTPRHFEDNVLFDDAEGRLAASGSALRIRRAGERACITFKGPRSVVEGAKRRTEIETEVADAEATRALLESLGFRQVFRYQKRRETYTWREVVLCLDETPIGPFLEIEGPLAEIHAAAAALGLKQNDYMAESYVDLFFAGGGRGDLVFP